METSKNQIQKSNFNKQHYERLILSNTKFTLPYKACTSYRSMLSSLPEIIFFDVYGTLFVSSLGDISVSKSHISPRHFYQTLKIAAYNPHNSAGTAARDLYYSTIEEIHTRLRNEKNSFPEVDIRAVWQQVITVLGKNELIFKTEQSLSTEEVSILFESLTNPVFPMPGLEETLSYLKEMNCIIGIISNAQFYTPSIFSAFTGKSVSQLGFQEQLCFFSYEYASAKPGTYLFNIAGKKIRNEFAAEGEIIYVGNDMLNDISAAKSAGFKTALFAGDKRSLRLRSDDPRCNDIKPDLVITDLRQLKWL